MTLDEVIEYFETEVKKSNSLVMPYESRKKYSDDCKQMVEWLRELKMFKDLEAQGYAMYKVSEVNTNANSD